MKKVFEYSCNIAMMLICIYISRTTLIIDDWKIELTIEKPMYGLCSIIVAFIVLAIMDASNNNQDTLDYP